MAQPKETTWNTRNKADRERSQEATWVAEWWHSMNAEERLAAYPELWRAAKDANVAVALENLGGLLLHGTRGAINDFLRRSDFFAGVRETRKAAQVATSDEMLVVA
jgi:hypothetical protein